MITTTFKTFYKGLASFGINTLHQTKETVSFSLDGFLSFFFDS